MIFRLFRKPPDPIANLHGDIVAAVRDVRLYTEFGVADDFTGRFELLALVTTLVLRRLNESRAAPAAPEGVEAAQALVNHLFAALDRDLRQIGIGDVSVPKTMKRLAGSFYGRAGAYAAALAPGASESTLVETLVRNLYGGAAPAQVDLAHLAASVRRMAGRIAAMSVATLVAGGALGTLLDARAGARVLQGTAPEDVNG